jgi:hypothetical protein
VSGSFVGLRVNLQSADHNQPGRKRERESAHDRPLSEIAY